jgi:asparagine synthase (glutamine-hydrolysing)
LEVRCPFLDTRLVEWAVQLPDRMKIRGGQLKYVLKRAFKDMLPEEVLTRGKMGFGVPLGHWMRHDLRDFSHDLLLGSSSKIQGFVQPARVQGLLREHQEGLQDHGQKIWVLLSLEVWLRNFQRWEPAALPVAEMHSA